MLMCLSPHPAVHGVDMYPQLRLWIFQNLHQFLESFLATHTQDVHRLSHTKVGQTVCLATSLCYCTALRATNLQDDKVGLSFSQLLAGLNHDSGRLLNRPGSKHSTSFESTTLLKETFRASSFHSALGQTCNPQASYNDRSISTVGDFVRHPMDSPYLADMKDISA